MKISEQGVMLEETDSTSSHLRRLIASGSAPRFVAARRQTAGRGRQGKSFYSPEGGLYVTFLVAREEIRFPQLVTPMAALAVRGAIYRRLGVLCGIKWVNDLYLNGKKIGGILSEAQFGYFLVGIGLNLKAAPSVPPELEGIYGALGTKDEDPAEWIRQLQAEWRHLLTLPRNELVEQYRRAMFLVGKEIRYTENGAEFRARCVGTDDDLHLIVETDGVRKTLSSGEVSVML